MNLEDLDHPVRPFPPTDRRRRPHCYCLTAAGLPYQAYSIDAWCRWMEGADRRVAVTVVPPFYTVSTIFTGLDYAVSGAPILWETMVFRRPGVVVASHRYHSRAEAVVGHRALTTAYRLHVLPYAVLAVLLAVAAGLAVARGLTWFGVL